MNPNHKKSIGIDVCKNYVNVVHLEKNGNAITLTDSIYLPLNTEMLNGNSAAEFKSLAGTLKKLKLAKRLEHCDAGLCVCSSPELLQILKLPDSSPHASIKFIQEEIRQYAVLPLKNIQTDYCTLHSAIGSEHKSVLVGACQTEPLSAAVKELEKIQIDINLIEPAIVSLIRACYKKIIRASDQKNTMLVLIRDDIINVCVFCGHKFDFLRTKKLNTTNSDSPALLDEIAEQIESVLQFYELERSSEQKKWQIFLSCCPRASLSGELAGQLKDRVHRQDLEISAIGAEHLNIINKNKAGNDFSAVAIGVAMKLLDSTDSEISINLIPDEISKDRKSYNHLMVIANVAAVILMLLFLHIGRLSIKTTEAKTELANKTKLYSSLNISKLAGTQADVNEQTCQITKNISDINDAIKNKGWNNWAYVLAEISLKAPNTIQIHKLQSRDSKSITIEGIAVNYAAINEFTARLTNCKTISSAQLADTKQNMQYGNGVIDYSINCTLIPQDIKEN